MMTDRELLELAAKAAGIPIWTDIDGTVFTDDQNGIEVEWNPLTDDGDALRLAVKLYFDVGIQDGYSEVITDNFASFQTAHDGDPYAATRRAIVLAAAEIGKEE